MTAICRNEKVLILMAHVTVRSFDTFSDLLDALQFAVLQINWHFIFEAKERPLPTNLWPPGNDRVAIRHR